MSGDFSAPAFLARATGARRRLGRGLLRALAGAGLLLAQRAYADDVIVDPELEKTSPSEQKTPPAEQKPASGADHVIEDPELAGSHSATTSPVPAPSVSTRGETTWRFSAHSRWGLDTTWTSPRQDIVEGTTVVSVEAEQRPSESLMYSLGLRVRHAVGIRRNGSARYELDLEPTSAFVDGTPGDGYHLRAGYQFVPLGRFDILSATNFLEAYDLRSGAVTMPEAAAIAQPALRFDFDKISGFTLQAYYLPFFQPHLVTGYGSDYAPPFDKFIDDSLRAQAAANPGSTPVDPRIALAGLNRSTVARASTGLLQAFAPPADLTHPQGALRATFNGEAGELAFTGGTALERIPALTFSDALTRAFLSGTALPSSLPPDAVRLDYNRFWMASVDGATDAGPVQLGVELAYMANRTFYAVGPTTAVPGPLPGSAPLQVVPPPIAERVGVLHGGLRAELVEGAGWAAEVETLLEVVAGDAQTPAGGTGTWRWQGFQSGRWFAALAGGAHWAPEGSRLKLEAGGMVFTGPSYVIFPRIEWEAVHTLFLELGAAFVGGVAPPGGTNFAANAQMVSLGWLYTDVDQVFVGVRWTP